MPADSTPEKTASPGDMPRVPLKPLKSDLGDPWRPGHEEPEVPPGEGGSVESVLAEIDKAQGTPEEADDEPAENA